MRIVNLIGKKGEDLAVEYLKKKGYKILEGNYRKQYAEIDIIASNDNMLIFVEVKTRTSSQFGTPLEAITPWKLRPILKLVHYYHFLHPEHPRQLRIDAIGITLHEEGLPKIEHIENISGF